MKNLKQVKGKSRPDLLEKAKAHFNLGICEVLETGIDGVFQLNTSNGNSILWNPEKGFSSFWFSTKLGWKYLEEFNLFQLKDSNGNSILWNPENGFSSFWFSTKLADNLIARLKPLPEEFKSKLEKGKFIGLNSTVCVFSKSKLESVLSEGVFENLIAFSEKEEFVSAINSFEGDCTKTNYDEVLQLKPGKVYPLVYGDPIHFKGKVEESIYVSEKGFHHLILIDGKIPCFFTCERLRLDK